MIWYVARLLLLLRLISLWDNVFLSWTIMMHWNAKISSYRPISMMLWHHKIIVIIYVFKICNLWVCNISYIECRFLEIQLMNFGNLRGKKSFLHILCMFSKHYILYYSHGLVLHVAFFMTSLEFFKMNLKLKMTVDGNKKICIYFWDQCGAVLHMLQTGASVCTCKCVDIPITVL